MTVVFTVILDEMKPNLKKHKGNQNYNCLRDCVFQKNADYEKNNRYGQTNVFYRFHIDCSFLYDSIVPPFCENNLK